MGHAAGVDDHQVGSLGCLNLPETEAFEQLANLLTFVLIDFAAKSINGKSLHGMVA